MLRFSALSFLGLFSTTVRVLAFSRNSTSWNARINYEEEEDVG